MRALLATAALGFRLSAVSSRLRLAARLSPRHGGQRV